ncbi:MAG: hypothetical protein HON70_10740, partial [Lentisphaerae bacterium]|nr:hypothetical protein [Lentisphaerota bacterium]
WSDGNAYAQSPPPDEASSFVLVPEFGEDLSLRNGTESAGRSLDGMPVGPYWRQSRSTTLDLSSLRVLSTTATTANIEFFSNLASSGTMDYGATPDCEDRLHLTPAETFKTVSFTGLTPGRECFFKVSLGASVRRHYSNQELPEELRKGRRNLVTEVETFRTLATDAPPRTRHVVTTGDDEWEGTEERPWRSIGHAATQAVAGDTVVVHGGVYRENIRIRATGDAERPLVFRSARGEKVWIDGCQRQMRNGFCLFHKKHVIVDYFHFKWQQDHSTGAGILLRNSESVRLSRCFYDGRGKGYSPPFVKAFSCRKLSVDNSFLTRGFSGSLFQSCPDLHVRNTVFYINQLSSIGLQNKAGEKALFEKNIVVDNTLQKLPNPLYVMRDAASLEERDNCYYLRISPDMKTMIGYSYYNDEQLPMKPAVDGQDILSQQWRRQGRFCREMSTYAQFLQRTGRQGNAVFVDPQMQALPKLITFKDWEDWLGFSRYRAQHSRDEYHGNDELDFPDFFTGNPELRARGIGLQQELFRN